MKIKNILTVVMSVGIWLLTIAPSHAVTITYDNINGGIVNYTAPVLIAGLEFDGAFWDVAVHWDSSYNNTYTSAPMFSGDVTASQAATNAIQQALLNDSFTGTGLGGSYLITPYSTSFGYGIWGDTMAVGIVNFAPANNYDTSGFSTWTPSAVPVPGAVWLFGSGLIGLVGLARRKKA